MRLNPLPPPSFKDEVGPRLVDPPEDKSFTVRVELVHYDINGVPWTKQAYASENMGKAMAEMIYQSARRVVQE